MVSSCYDGVCKQEKCYSSGHSSSCDINGHFKIPVVEVLGKEEDVNDKSSNFSDYVTNVPTVVNVSSHPNYDHTQWEQISDEVLLSVDEISELLACDFERYVNSSMDVSSSHFYSFAYGEVSSPKFDVETVAKLETYLSSFGGVLDMSSNVCTHDDFYHMKHILKRRHSVDSFSSHANDVGLGLECSYDNECNVDKLFMTKHFLDGFSYLAINPLLEC